MPINCMVCGKECHYIQYRHLLRHGMTVAQYRAQFPDAPLSSSETKEKQSVGIRAAWADPNSSVHTRDRTVSEETRAKISANSKRLWADPNSGLHKMNREYITPEFKQKMTDIVKARWQNPNDGVRNPERGKKIWDKRRADGTDKNPHKGKTYEEVMGVEEAERVRQLRRDSRYWSFVPDESRRRNSAIAAHLIRTDPEHRARVIASLKEGRQAMWDGMTIEQKNERIRNVMLANQLKPNKPEQYITTFLDFIFPGEWKYVGDGQCIIGGKCPDFINVNGQKKIIELYGDYWHRGQDPQERIGIFAQYGYDTLVVWERELKNFKKLGKRLAQFGCV